MHASADGGVGLWEKGRCRVTRALMVDKGECRVIVG